MPGAAATTAGMALSGGVAVMMCPSTMNSSSVVGLEVGRRQEADLHGHGRTPGDLDDPAVLLDLPVRFQRLAFAPADVDLDDGLVADDSLPAGVDPGHAARRDRPRPEVEVLGGLGVLGVAAHLVEFDPERVGDHPHRLAEDPGAVRRHRLQVGMVDGLAEADRLLGGR